MVLTASTARVQVQVQEILGSSRKVDYVEHIVSTSTTNTIPDIFLDKKKEDEEAEILNLKRGTNEILTRDRLIC